MMKPKGLGKICYIISDTDKCDDTLIKLINYQVKRVAAVSVIVNDNVLRKAQAGFSKKVNLYNTYMNLTDKSRNTFSAMFKIIKPTAVFVFENDADAIQFVDYSRIKATKIVLREKCGYKDKTLSVSDDVAQSSDFMVKFLEKKYSMDFYPKHYLQTKSLYAKMKPKELLDARFNRSRRVKLAFVKEWGYELPDVPVTYNEKLNYFKTLSTYKKYRKYTDKFKVRKYLEKEGYKEYLPESFGYTKQKITKKLWESLPEKFVIKPTNSSGLNIVVEDKALYNLSVINRVLAYIKGVHYGLYKNEPVYSFKNNFLITEFIPDLTDYKFFCFDGKIEFVAVVKALKRESENNEPYQVIVDKAFNELPFSYGYERGNCVYEKPVYFEEMAILAEKLSKKFRHVRVDMMGMEKRFYFGEFTFFSAGGNDRFSPPEYDEFYGNLIKIEANRH